MESASSDSLGFVSYSREDKEFVRRLTGDLRRAGVLVWVDMDDIVIGERWDQSVGAALTRCDRIFVVLSPTSVKSEEVLNEIHFALEKRKRIFPVLFQKCDVPYRIARLQRADFQGDYNGGLEQLLKNLRAKETALNDAEAIIAEGDKYFFGKDVEQNYERARESYREAADMGSARAMYYLGNMYEHAVPYFGAERGDFDKARSWYEKSAAAGYGDAMAILGYQYEEGCGVTEDVAKALEWYRKGVEAGGGLAMAGLGGMYEQGKGVSRDLDEARRLYRRGADLGSGEAMSRLGHSYFMQGNTLEARSWCEKGVRAGSCNLNALSDLAKMLIKTDKKNSMRWHMVRGEMNSYKQGMPIRWTMIYPRRG